MCSVEHQLPARFCVVRVKQGDMLWRLWRLYCTGSPRLIGTRGTALAAAAKFLSLESNCTRLGQPIGDNFYPTSRWSGYSVINCITGDFPFFSLSNLVPQPHIYLQVSILPLLLSPLCVVHIASTLLTTTTTSPPWHRPTITNHTPRRSMAPQPLPPSRLPNLVTCRSSRDAASTSRSIRRKAVLLPQKKPPMPISTRSLHQSVLGGRARMSRTGWPTPGLSRTGKSVSPP